MSEPAQLHPDQSAVANIHTPAPLHGAHHWARWPIAVVLLGGSGGALALQGPSAKQVASLESDVDRLEAEAVSRADAYESRIDVLEAEAAAIARAYEMAALALEISVDGHRYLSDLIVDVAKLDHPGYSPPGQDPRLQRRIVRGGQLLDDLGAPKP
jgi:hypothetical protein